MIHQDYLPICVGFYSDITAIKIDISNSLDTEMLSTYSHPTSLSYSPVDIGDSVMLTVFGCSQMDELTSCLDSATFFDKYWKY